MAQIGRSVISRFDIMNISLNEDVMAPIKTQKELHVNDYLADSEDV
jgi:hypothetical protein